MRIVCCIWEHQIVMRVTIHNSFVLRNCPYCKLRLHTVCDLSAAMYVTYVCTVYTGHIPELTVRCCLVRGHNGGSTDKGERDWDKHGSHRDQSGPSSIVDNC